MNYIKRFLQPCNNCREFKLMFHMKRVFHMKHQVQALLCEECFEIQDNFVIETSPYITFEELRIELN